MTKGKEPRLMPRLFSFMVNMWYNVFGFLGNFL